MGLKDELKRRPDAPLPPAPQVDVKIDNEAATAITKVMQGFVKDILAVLVTAMTENARILVEIGQRLDLHQEAVEKLLAKDYTMPDIVFPPRPREFGVEIENNEDGQPTSMRISVTDKLH